MAYGFVYLLASKCMPNLYKIGCTERSPSKRAEELSSATGVPRQFDLICYGEMKDYDKVERQFHRWLEHKRENPSREFFRTENLAYLVGLFLNHPNLLSFAICSGYHQYIPPAAEIPNPWDQAAVEKHLAERASKLELVESY